MIWEVWIKLAVINIYLWNKFAFLFKKEYFIVQQKLSCYIDLIKISLNMQ